MKGALYSSFLKAFVSYNEKQIHCWSELSGKQLFKVDIYQETGSHQISTVCFSEKRRLFFVMATDFKLHVYNENFICVGSVMTDAGVVQQAQYYDKMDAVMTAGMNGCIILQLQIKCKYSPETAI